jgi:predicted nucleotidyltransferase
MIPEAIIVYGIRRMASPKSCVFSNNRGIGMDENLVQQLKERNNRIIQAIIKKADKACPGSVALIGIAGSFCTGDFHEKSDLDLCVVINDDAGRNIEICFILGEVAHDIYCTPWNRLEEMSHYNNPYVVKLLNLDIIHYADDKYLQRYMGFRKQLKCKLSRPLSPEDVDKAEKHLGDALKAFTEVILRDSVGECKYASAKMLCYIEHVVYMVNKTYVKQGIKQIPEEIREMKCLPLGFFDSFTRVVEADSVEIIKDSSTKLIKMVNEYVRKLRNQLRARKEVTNSALVGTYEEVYSNWRNKMYRAAEKGDVYLSLMTDSSCQQFYDEMCENYNTKRINVLGYPLDSPAPYRLCCRL